MSSYKYPSNLAPEYRPMGAWEYFGYSLLYSIPIVGLILAFVFAFNNDNIHRKNHALAFLFTLAIVIVLSVCLFFTAFTVLRRVFL